MAQHMLSHGSDEPAAQAPPAMGAREKGFAPTEDAPGTYVFQR